MRRCKDNMTVDMRETSCDSYRWLNWFSHDDWSLLECDAVLDESSPWQWRQYDPSKRQKLLAQSQSIISYLFHLQQNCSENLKCYRVALVMIKHLWLLPEFIINTRTILIAGIPYKQREISSLILKWFHPMYGPQDIPFQRRIYICRLVMLLADLRVFSSICF